MPLNRNIFLPFAGTAGVNFRPVRLYLAQPFQMFIERCPVIFEISLHRIFERLDGRHFEQVELQAQHGVAIRVVGDRIDVHHGGALLVGVGKWVCLGL
jgi:hypothetical protein